MKGPLIRTALCVGSRLDRDECDMRDFANASFSPEKIEAMTSALQAAIDTLPEPVTSHHVNRLAEAILRAARDGESDAVVLQRMALLELQIGPAG